MDTFWICGSHEEYITLLAGVILCRCYFMQGEEDSAKPYRGPLHTATHEANRVCHANLFTTGYPF